ncbi:MAG: hypothetical protein QOC93_850 [Actinomycetota bacterium]|nr:hypothetical protein [Cryptosporangiaceae bacterium]MDQ1675706.1 hypothetical protein [Actinomycetota bacterium]
MHRHPHVGYLVTRDADGELCFVAVEPARTVPDAAESPLPGDTTVADLLACLRQSGVPVRWRSGELDVTLHLVEIPVAVRPR